MGDRITKYDADFVIIGSGFGGSVSALRLAEKGYSVLVLERGKKLEAKDFPKSNWNVFRYLWMPLLRCFGIQAMTLFRNVLILSGSGVGGGSLVYANTLLEPGDAFYASPVWNQLAAWKKELAEHYATAKRMLGVTVNPYMTEVDATLKHCASDMGKEETFTSVPVGIYFGAPGKEGQLVPDPYFGGAGPPRTGCNHCGGCMVGCRFGAKNTLDKNYLFFAQKHGAEIKPELEVSEIWPLNDAGEADVRATGKNGYKIVAQKITDFWPIRRRYTFYAKSVVLSAGVLGSVNLLLRMKQKIASMPRISAKLGQYVRTNSEALVGVTLRKPGMDCSNGIAISSGFQADPHTFIEPVRYPKGSSFMRLLAVPMVDGSPDGTSQFWLFRFAKIIAAFLKNPLDLLRLMTTRDWAKNTVIFLVMQSLDNKMNFVLGRDWSTLFRRRMTTEMNAKEAVEKNIAPPAYIPVGNEVARRYAEKVNGIPQSAINEISLEIPTTAHILGGCVIGGSAEVGVIDPQHRLFHYENFRVCDGSAIPANLGVNPSLTITAMTERAMSFIPKKSSEKVG